MPRPRVRPENRQRSSRACLGCQASKIRCDSQLPCVSCVRRDRASACTYIEPTRRRSHRSFPYTSGRITRIRSEVYSTPTREERGPVLQDAEYDTSSLVDAEEDQTHEATGISDRSPESTAGRLLLSSQGEKVYIGETSSLSFLQFLRDIMVQYMGPSSFTDNGRANIMLEADINSEPIGTFEDSRQIRDLAVAYFEASNGYLYLFCKGEIYELLNSQIPGTGLTEPKRDSLALLYLVIAIGGQCRGSCHLDLQYAAHYFAKGQAIAFEGMLKDPSITMVRIFLLMTFYMLGACHRNAAYMYLGVASKAAAALGLHVAKQYEGLSEDEYIARMDAFRSLRVLDLVVCSLLGRPVGSLPLDAHASLKDPRSRYGLDNLLSIEAAYEGSALLGEIVQELKKGDGCISSTVAETFLERLRYWIEKLPSKLRHFSKQDDAPVTSVDRETVIGNVNVACIYYFAVILTTRSFLISHLMSQLREGREITLRTPANIEARSEENTPTVAQLAEVCLNSAILMGHMCEKAMTSGLLLNNMCIMKACVFAAGLILGFALFVQEEGPSCRDIQSAFVKARRVLRLLADLSPQAKHYHEILASFAEAIAKYRQQRRTTKQKKTNKYIDQVLSIDIVDSSPSRPDEYSDMLGLNDLLGDEQRRQSPRRERNANSFVVNEGTGLNNGIDQEDPSADDCPYSIDYEPFGLLFEGM